ncbi:MAG: alginate lyase family protein [Acidobacteriota bacterium]
MQLLNLFQEVRELGLKGTLFRAKWELTLRSGYLQQRQVTPQFDNNWLNSDWIKQLPFSNPNEVAEVMRDRIPKENIARLINIARDAIHGRILCFSRWSANYGDPIDWYLNPTNGKRWNEKLHWSRALSEEPVNGDIKLTWEVGRFPQAYHLARAAIFASTSASEFAQAFIHQCINFICATPYGYGVHWHSGQDMVFRLIAWLFACQTFSACSSSIKELITGIEQELLKYIAACAAHIEMNIDYARHAVYNNHLLSEALGLVLVSDILPALPQSTHWRTIGLSILEQQAIRQFYSDGAYIQQSHNYHRLALQDLLLASTLTQARGRTLPQSWLQAMERSLDFLVAHQNPIDGRLPNYGANDGALPMILSTCDYTDFRPELQAVSLLTRGECIYEPGPWDETAAWLMGADALQAPLRARERHSISFNTTGYHVLRGNNRSNFASFRCGSLKDRFSQIDMLHLDVWWRGLNVLVDGGSYLYNGPADWHNHFFRTASHNTVTIDNQDQMLHHRRFKCLYWTQARLLRFKDTDRYVLCAGEHSGYQRRIGNCLHRRTILFIKDDFWIVVDHISGNGNHTAKLHWLCGDFPYHYFPSTERITLDTPAGPFFLQILDDAAKPLAVDVIVGRDNPPRGWLARYYGEKVAVPSLLVEQQGELPITFVSLLGAVEKEASLDSGKWSIGDLRFHLQDGLIVVEE